MKSNKMKTIIEYQIGVIYCTKNITKIKETPKGTNFEVCYKYNLSNLGLISLRAKMKKTSKKTYRLKNWEMFV